MAQEETTFMNGNGGSSVGGGGSGGGSGGGMEDNIVTRGRKVTFAAPTESERLLEKLRRMFEEADANNDKVLDFDEFRVLMKEWMPDSTEQQLRTLFDAFDVDKSGAIKYTELLESDFIAQFLLMQSEVKFSSPVPNDIVTGITTTTTINNNNNNNNNNNTTNININSNAITNGIGNGIMNMNGIDHEEINRHNDRTNIPTLEESDYDLHARDMMQRKNQEIQQLNQWINDIGKPAQKQCEEYRKENARLLDEKRRLEMQVEQHAQEIQTLSTDNDELNKCLEKLQTLDKERNDKLDRLASDAQMRNEMESQLTQLEQENHEARAMISNLMETGRTQNASIAKLNRENTRLSIENQAHTQTIESLRRDITRSEEELSSLRALNHSYLNDMVNLRAQIDDLNTQLARSTLPEMTEFTMSASPPTRSRGDTRYIVDKPMPLSLPEQHPQKSAVKFALEKSLVPNNGLTGLEETTTRQHADSVGSDTGSDVDFHDDNISMHSNHSAVGQVPVENLGALAKPSATGISNRERLNNVYNKLQKQKTMMLDIHGAHHMQTLDRQISNGTDGKHNKMFSPLYGSMKVPRVRAKEPHNMHRLGSLNEETMNLLAEKVSDSLVVKIQDKLQIADQKKSKKNTDHDSQEIRELELIPEINNEHEKMYEENKPNISESRSDTLGLSLQILNEITGMKDSMQNNTNQLTQLYHQLNELSSETSHISRNQNGSNGNTTTGSIQIISGEDLLKNLDQRFGELRTNISNDLTTVIQENSNTSTTNNNNNTTSTQYWWEWW